MPRALLTISVPERLWLGEFTRQYPDATFTILTAFPVADSGVALAEITADDLDAVLSDMEAREEITELDLLGRPDSKALVQFETADPLLLVPIKESGALLDLPFEVRDGEVHWEVTASRGRLSELGDQLRLLDIDFVVESVTQLVETDRLLTERQSKLVEAAVEEGYYDTPRNCTLTDLADSVGIAKSTASETLHRAEEKIIKKFAEDSEPIE